MANLDRIRRLSRVLRGAIALGMAAFLIVPPLSWTFEGWLRSSPEFSDFMPATLLLWQQVAGGLMATAVGLVGVWMLSALWRLFGLYAEGRIFEAENVLALRRFGIRLLAYAAAAVLGNTLMILVLTATAPEGQRMLSIGINDGHIVAAILAGVFIVIAKVMDEGRQLQEDQAAIV